MQKWALLSIQSLHSKRTRNSKSVSTRDLVSTKKTSRIKENSSLKYSHLKMFAQMSWLSNLYIIIFFLIRFFNPKKNFELIQTLCWFYLSEQIVKNMNLYTKIAHFFNETYMCYTSCVIHIYVSVILNLLWNHTVWYSLE